MDLKSLNLKQTSDLVKRGEVKALELVEFYLGRIQNFNKDLNAFVALNESVENEAREIDKQRSLGLPLGKLAGVPVGIKDLICTQGLRTTAASKMLANFVPPYDATVIKRLRKEGVLVLGKLNLDEFAMGSSNETSVFGPVKNPWDLSRVPGGSSGGSAAAQAARLCAATLGTDTGGSIRQPSNFCGIVGLKPTYGRVSRYGVIAYASSLDQVGPMVSSVEDAALVLEAMAGFDSNDSTTSQRPVPAWTQLISKDLKGKKAALIKEQVESDAIHPDTRKAFELAKESLIKRGVDFVEVSVPATAFAVPIYYLISASEASSNLSRYDGVKYGHRAHFDQLSSISLQDFYAHTRAQGFGQEVKRRIMLGTYCLSSGFFDAYYKKACQVRRILQSQFLEIFEKADFILSPVSTSPAFRIGERVDDPLKMYLNDVYTVSTNLCGLPGMSVPFSTSQEGLPIGIQLTARAFDEQTLFDVGSCLEEDAQLKQRTPHAYS